MTGQNFDRFILWAGMLPDDLDFTTRKKYFSDKKLHFVYGTEDEFLTEKRLKWFEDFAKKQQMEFDVFAFDGNHTVDKEALMGCTIFMGCWATEL